MINLKKLILVILCLLIQNISFGQLIHFQNAENNYVCQNSEFFITIENNTQEKLEQIVLDLEFPCDGIYIIGSVSGAATEYDTSNLNHPTFIISDIDTGNTSRIAFFINFSCATLDCINNGEDFINTVNLNFQGGSLLNIKSPKYNIETALLLFTQIEDPIVYGKQGETVKRKLTVKNTRPGLLSSFFFSDSHGSEISISADVGNDISTNTNKLILEFTSEDFQNIGDGDEWFEFNEEIVIEESIYSSTCPLQNYHATTYIGLDWGCGDEICDNFTQNTAIIIEEVPFPPSVFTETSISDPTCFCVNEIIQQCIHLENISIEKLVENIEFTINDLSNYASILSSSFRIINGDDTSSVTSVLSDDGLRVIVPRLESLSSIDLCWEVNISSPDTICNSMAHRWSFSYKYDEICGEIFDSVFTEPIIVRQFPFLIRSRLFKQIFNSQEGKYLLLQVKSPFLTQEEDLLNIDFNLPCGVVLPNNPIWLLGGKSPISSNVTLSDSTTFVSLVFETPFLDEVDTLKIPFLFDLEAMCLDSSIAIISEYVSSCENTCKVFVNGNGPKFIIEYEASIHLDQDCPEGCDPRVCGQEEYHFPVPTTSETIYLDTIPGYVFQNFQIERINFGQADNDNDHFPDQNGILNKDSLELNHYTIGDTLRALIDVEIFTEQEDFQFTDALIKLNTGFRVQSFYKNVGSFEEFITSDSGFVNIKRIARIWDKDRNVHYEIPSVPFFGGLASEEDSLGFLFDLSLNTLRASTTNIPIDYFYENGDSIQFLAEYVIKHNFNRNATEFKVLPLFMQVETIIDNKPIVDIYNSFACNCVLKKFEIANIISNVNDNNGSIIDLCNTTLIGESHKTIIAMGSHSNFFPNEYRSNVKLDQISFPKIEGLNLLDLYISKLESNGKLIETIDYPIIIPHTIYKDTVIAYICEDILGFYRYDISHLDLSYDDNLVITFTTKYENQGCAFNGNFNYHDSTGISFDILPQNLIYGHKVEKAVKYPLRGKNLDLILNYELCESTSLNDSVTWNISLIHTKNQGCGKSSNPLLQTDAPLVWLEVSNINGLIDGYRLTNRKTHEEYDSEDGFFQLNTFLKEDTLNLQLTAVNHSCVKEEVTFDIGWSCETELEDEYQRCFEASLECSVISPPGVIDIIPDPFGISANLCEEMPYSEVRFINAGLGAIFEMNVSAQLPFGLGYVPNSSQISWDADSQNYLNIIDPSISSMGKLQWNMDSIMGELWRHGFPGANSSPENTISLRFKTISTCDFIVGTSIRYEAMGAQVCDDPSNSIFKIGKTIDITGVYTDQEIDVTADYHFVSSCDDIYQLNIHLQSIDVIHADSKIIFEIPSIFQFVPNSCSGDILDCSPLHNGNTLVFTLPDLLSSIDFSIHLKSLGNVDCQVLTIPIKTVTTTNAFCVTDNDTCQVDIISGEFSLNLMIEKPSFKFGTVSLDIDAEMNLNYEIFNNGILNNDPIMMNLYFDKNNDGQITSIDSLIEQLSLDITIGSNESVILNMVLDQKLQSILCNLILVIDKDENCACEGDQVIISAPNTIDYIVYDTICSSEILIIGIEEIVPDLIYQWSDNEGIDCSNCAKTNFQYINQGFYTEVIELTLTVTNDNACQVVYHYNIEVLPQLKIWYATEQVCVGEEVLLVATDGLIYQWEGNDVTDPYAQIQKIYPIETSVYHLTITNSFGCEAIDSALVEVIAIPIADAGADIEVCKGQESFLNAVILENQSYHWTPGFPFIDHDDIPNPKVLTDVNTSFLLTVGNGECIDVDTVNIVFKNDIELDIFGNHAICNGDTLYLSLSGADQYIWQPRYVDMCLDDDCTEVMVHVNEDTEFKIIGIDEDGCRDSIVVLVDVIEDFILTNIDTSICKNESIDLFGELVFEAGTYCDTMNTDFGCMNITCFNLLLLDTILLERTEYICPGDSIEFYEFTITGEGRYCHVTSTDIGCDSTICLTIILKESKSTNEQVEICEGETYVFEDLILEETGEYCMIFTGVNTCDSIHCVNLLVVDHKKVMEEIMICSGDFYVFNGENIYDSGTYCLDTTTLEGCDSTYCIELSFFQDSPLNIETGKTSVVRGDSTTLTVLEMFDSYLWKSESWLNCDTCQTITIKPEESSYFLVEVINEFGCVSMDSIWIEVLAKCNNRDILIPNAFTPDGNEKNDLFRVANFDSAQDIHIMIFNRWGTKLYESNDNSGWDGQYDNKKAPAEMYIYIITVSCIGEESQLFKGDLTLLR